MTKTLLKADNLTVGYDKKAVISDINFTAEKGQIICLLGPNGAGKSTILRTISGLLAPVSGTVTIDGESISRIKPKELAKKMSLVLTEPLSPAMTTVFSLVSMGRTPYTDFIGRLSDDDRRIIGESLEAAGVYHLRDRYFDELSDGEKQKVMIARALVQQPELIILDEPTSHLDIRHKIEVIHILQKLSNEKGITCILSLHDIDLAIKGCQTVMLVNDGKIIDHGTPEEIISEGVIDRLYGISGGAYNELMGSAELKGADRNDIFIAAGNGTGIRLYRSLARSGYGITTGVIHENDRDNDVSSRICAKTITESAFEPISEKHLSEAVQTALSAEYIIDSGFPVGAINKGNITLLKKTAEAGKTVFSLRPPEEIKTLFGGCSENIIFVENISAIIGKH